MVNNPAHHPLAGALAGDSLQVARTAPELASTSVNIVHVQRAPPARVPASLGGALAACRRAEGTLRVAAACDAQRPEGAAEALVQGLGDPVLQQAVYEDVCSISRQISTALGEGQDCLSRGVGMGASGFAPPSQAGPLAGPGLLPTTAVAARRPRPAERQAGGGDAAVMPAVARRHGHLPCPSHLPRPRHLVRQQQVRRSAVSYFAPPPAFLACPARTQLRRDELLPCEEREWHGDLLVSYYGGAIIP